MKEHVDIFAPVFVIRLVLLGISWLNKRAENCQVINKLQQLSNILCDGVTVGIHSLQMFSIRLTNTFNSCIHRLIVGVCLAFWPLGRLHRHNGVRHCARCFTVATADEALKARGGLETGAYIIL